MRRTDARRHGDRATARHHHQSPRRHDALHYNGQKYELNLIDTPGHVDFHYEVSRSLACCEGRGVVVDAFQGVEAQTVANAFAAMEHDLKIVPPEQDRPEPRAARRSQSARWSRRSASTPTKCWPAAARPASAARRVAARRDRAHPAPTKAIPKRRSKRWCSTRTTTNSAAPSPTSAS
jgi:hypothetical protein